MVSRVLIVPIRIWQLTFSKLLPPTCRFSPSCSAYTIEALRRHGPLKGLWLGARRLGRCHPWGPSGYDPVP
ncbi:membrane protein insertion efficiency factor YidD [Polymorphobacter fuscus]|uniref:Putative membrane protein insertion efficiency factor n=1 Tax=Sandarakinorhabdus fusca TaxID=1439888 RepID=A0A7C9KH79_9SPHN|nr:membrane protein insertion efficiency factor YidD [Polymorphobacter fuscus]KAB7647972.1 membrane protein insertion efficiency factor YidD [Polymorphobacter fuscus]MQT16660.1 membrane protein insertion efficiency factor YidD [Polymorphobacter fuscus]